MTCDLRRCDLLISFLSLTILYNNLTSLCAISAEHIVEIVTELVSFFFYVVILSLISDIIESRTLQVRETNSLLYVRVLDK